MSTTWSARCLPPALAPTRPQIASCREHMAAARESGGTWRVRQHPQPCPSATACRADVPAGTGIHRGARLPPSPLFRSNRSSRPGLPGPGSTDTAASQYDRTVIWAQAAHAGTDVDGLVWMSRRWNSSKSMVLFGDRVSRSDLAVETGQGGCSPCQQLRLAIRPVPDGGRVGRSATHLTNIPFVSCPGRGPVSAPAHTLDTGLHRAVHPAASAAPAVASR